MGWSMTMITQIDHDDLFIAGSLMLASRPSYRPRGEHRSFLLSL
jgi:hypothetical protein